MLIKLAKSRHLPLTRGRARALDAGRKYIDSQNIRLTSPEGPHDRDSAIRKH